MRETTLLRIALCITLLGLAGLYALSIHVELEELPINKVDNTVLGQKAKVMGTVTNVINTPNAQILRVSQPSSISVFVPGDHTSLSTGDQVEIIGSVEEYKSEFEIIAERIRVLG